MPRFIDTHCHLDASIYERDLDIVVRHAQDENVDIVTLGSDLESSRRAVEIAERYPRGVYAAVGFHPSKVNADLLSDELANMSGFSELVTHPKVVAIGETGLDYHDLPTYSRNPAHVQLAERMRANQKKAFGRFLDLSREHRLPLLLHCREAHEDMLEMLETWDKTTRGFDSRGVVHCFSADWKTAKRFFNLDFMISVTGIQTHGGYQAEIVKKAPASRLVIESDCPHMTPTAFSIRRNEPSYLPLVAAAVAGIRGTSEAQVAAETTENALKVFTRIPR